MRHRKRRYKLGTGIDHRRSILRNLAAQLIQHHQINTSLTKAKALKAYFDKLVTLAKQDNLNSQRLLISRLGNKKQAAFDLIHKIVPKLQTRQSGYTTLKRLTLRKGDASLQAQLKIVFDPSSKTTSSKPSSAKSPKTTPKPKAKPAANPKPKTQKSQPKPPKPKVKKDKTK
ncbi:MAG: 50S ribosomal protein L17 [bacterium]|nr:50S ribosomal protein L17 [bacterium]